MNQDNKTLNNFRFALCDGHIRNIDDISEDNRRLSKYYCLGCGNELIPVLGKIREHHFRHKNHENCSNETYLHNLAKRKIKEYFDSNNDFLIRYNATNACEHFGHCPFHNCEKNLKRTINLKQYFDTCELEKVCAGFRPDILLSHSESPDRKLFIEINVHHPCSEEKLKSRFRIIEIDIDSDCVSFHPFDENSANIHFYNFKFDREIVPQKKTTRFSVLSNKEGKNEAMIDMINCNSFNQHLDNSLFDILLLNYNYSDFPLLGYSFCVAKNMTVPNCVFCHHYDLCNRIIIHKKINGRIVGKYTSPKNFKFDDLWELTKQCKHFSQNKSVYIRYVQNFGLYNYHLWERFPEKEK